MTLSGDKLYQAVVNFSAAGDNVVIGPGAAASPEFPSSFDNPATYIAIDFISLMPNANTTLTFNSGTSGEGQTAVTGPLTVVAQQPVTWENAIKHYQGIITLKPNRSFVINNLAAVQVTGMIRYRILMSS